MNRTQDIQDAVNRVLTAEGRLRRMLTRGSHALAGPLAMMAGLFAMVGVEGDDRNLYFWLVMLPVWGVLYGLLYWPRQIITRRLVSRWVAIDVGALPDEDQATARDLIFGGLVTGWAGDGTVRVRARMSSVSRQP